MPPASSRTILGMRVDVTTYEQAAERIVAWAREGRPAYVCVATVNNVMEAHDDPAFMRVMNESDLVTPDGMPLVWGLRGLGAGHASRVYGPDLTPLICQRASDAGVPVGFYGGKPQVLEALVRNIRVRFPALQVAYAWSPPFRPLSREEDAEVVRQINDAGARILFVGLGSPKQDVWMAAHRDRLEVVSVGVGAAFDILAGVKKQAPRAMQEAGLEWLYRLATEPRRVWRRYAKHNPRFLVLFLAQLIRRKDREGIA